MLHEKRNHHVQKERMVRQHVSSDLFADDYHARVAAHAPDIGDVYTPATVHLMALGSANVLSFQHMPERSHQLPPTHT
ncbi:hypothetical protein Hanom_Chr14g01287221 [Helianthus anomalus]